MFVEKTLMLVDAQDIVEWFKDFREERIKELPIKIQWAILFNVKELQPIVQKFEEFKDSVSQNLQNEYFGNDEKSVPFQREKVNENGDIIFDDNGNPVMEDLRKIKDEYIDEYQNKINDINDEIRALLLEKTTYKLKGIDVDKLVDSLNDNSSITLKDIDIMSFVNIDNADTE